MNDESWTVPGLSDAPTIAAIPRALPELYVDAGAVLEGRLEPRSTDAGGRRSDGLPMLYSGSSNVLLGAPEAGKTLIAGAMVADELFSAGRALWIDLDHNGPGAILSRLRQYGVPAEVLVDRSRFRLAVPEDAEAVGLLVDDARVWGPTIAVVDSVGELLPMFGASSNDADDYTRVNRAVLAALASSRAAVLAIDHEAKNADSRSYGATGSAAKKRAVDGALLRVSSVRQFAPGQGGEARLSIVKDRHGALRAQAGGSAEPAIASFSLEPVDGGLHYRFDVPTRMGADQLSADVERLLSLAVPPTSQREVKAALRCRSERASAAWRAFKECSPLLPGSGNNEGGEQS